MFVVRAKYIGTWDRPPGVGWLTKDGGVTRNIRQAQKYDTEDEAWLHAAASDTLGCDEDGDWAWVEEIAEGC